MGVLMTPGKQTSRVIARFTDDDGAHHVVRMRNLYTFLEVEGEIRYAIPIGDLPALRDAIQQAIRMNSDDR
jgi:hypothetical protein